MPAAAARRRIIAYAFAWGRGVLVSSRVLRPMVRKKMVVEPKHKPHQDDCNFKKRERERQEEALDEALKNTFPASDPVSAEQP
jgi:hypothetical protein